jgi:soluble lytic murein transglycosylase-like protein
VPHQLIGFTLVAAGLLAVGVFPASADLVYLQTGRTLSVKAHRIEGDTAVLILRGGGEVRCAVDLITRVAPDEVPYPEPAAPQQAAETQTQPVVPPLESRPYGDIIDALSAEHGVDARLVRAVIEVESRYEPAARSRKGAMGLMQLMPETARQYAVRNPYDPRANIEAGIKHLKSLLSRWDLSLALAAYNAGEAAVRRFGGIPPYSETRSYVARVTQLAGLARR